MISIWINDEMIFYSTAITKVNVWAGTAGLLGQQDRRGCLRQWKAL